jgi:NADH:ubiquinone oxidoreductase subunit F (NADH-binding)/Pyruvate/2-oxoacid:ferredoxin oxidoreductase delta subunit/(2Fe-2S) ferredoxin
MNRIETVDDLARMREELSARRPGEVVIRVCSTGCRALGALDVCDALDAEVAARELGDRVRIARVGCHGLCAGAVAVLIDPQSIFYQKVTPEDAAEIIERTVLAGEIIDRLCRQENGQSVPQRDSIAFYKHQMRLVLRNCGVVEPTSLEDAIAHGAYQGAARAISEMSPDEVITEVLDSGLRGRGGAGFPTGRKWQFARAASSDQKYIICNADEGDPGAFMDRALLEGDPHLVIEGMIVGAYAIGASKGYVYVRAEYPIAIEHTILALETARAAGLLGENILGSGFDFDIEIRQGAGAFVCGEETALIASIDGKRGMPRPRPPFPANSGLHDKPTNINNVETLASVPLVISSGAEKYASTGTEKSKGTKVFALAGKVVNTGLVEAPMGATLRQIVFDIGGGIPDDRQFKAAQMGGPSGGCIPAEFLDHLIDYDSLQEIGAIMGSGGLIVMDETTCMVDIARFFTEFVQSESCGKCAPCRIGTKRMLELLTRITLGEGELEDIDRLVKLGEMIKESSLCGLGQTAPNPVLSTIRYFRDEYVAHVTEGKCPAGICKALTTFVVDTEMCKACGMCVKVCPTNAIADGVKKVPAVIDQGKCISCGVCLETCKFDAVSTSGASND